MHVTSYCYRQCLIINTASLQFQACWLKQLNICRKYCLLYSVHCIDCNLDRYIHIGINTLEQWQVDNILLNSNWFKLNFNWFKFNFNWIQFQLNSISIEFNFNIFINFQAALFLQIWYLVSRHSDSNFDVQYMGSIWTVRWNIDVESQK